MPGSNQSRNLRLGIQWHESMYNTEGMLGIKLGVQVVGDATPVQKRYKLPWSCHFAKVI